MREEENSNSDGLDRLQRAAAEGQTAGRATLMNSSLDNVQEIWEENSGAIADGIADFIDGIDDDENHETNGLLDVVFSSPCDIPDASVERCLMAVLDMDSELKSQTDGAEALRLLSSSTGILSGVSTSNFI